MCCSINKEIQDYLDESHDREMDDLATEINEEMEAKADLIRKEGYFNDN